MRRFATVVGVWAISATLLVGCSSDGSKEPAPAESSVGADTAVEPSDSSAAVDTAVPETSTAVETSAPGETAVTGASGPSLKVVAAFGPLAELVQRVGGDAVTVENLTKTGVEPHDLEMNTDQIDAIQDAAIVVYLGDGFQAAVDDAVKGRKGPSLDLLTKVDPIEAGEEDHDHDHEGEAAAESTASDTVVEAAAEKEHDHGAHDPHFWLDPQRMAKAADAIRDELSAIAPDRAAEFATNAATYVAEMTALDGEITAGLKTCKLRTFVTAHAAFGYLASRYNLEQVAVAGISPEIEPDPARLAEVADLVKKEGVGTIFTEELVSPKVSEALARETGATTAVLSPVEGFTDDDVAAGATYATKMRENLAALRAALSCS